MTSTARPAQPPSGAPNAGHTNGGLALAVPNELMEAIAARVAELVASQIASPAAYLGVEQAAEYLACPKSRVYELVAQARVRHFRDGRRVLFRHEDLDAVLDVREPTA